MSGAITITIRIEQCRCRLYPGSRIDGEIPCETAVLGVEATHPASEFAMQDFQLSISVDIGDGRWRVAAPRELGPLHSAGFSVETIGHRRRVGEDVNVGFFTVLSRHEAAQSISLATSVNRRREAFDRTVANIVANMSQTCRKHVANMSQSDAIPVAITYS
jgi:hypothetical protein